MKTIGLLAASLVLWACRKPAVETAPEAGERPAAVAVARSGTVENGTFVDARGDFVMRVPDGWTVRTARAQDARRVTLDLADPPVRIEVFRRSGTDLGLPPHSTCEWRFAETQLRPLFRTVGDVTTASCTPTAFGAPERLSWIVQVDQWQWELAALVGPSDLVRGLEAAESVLSTVRWP